MSRRRLAGSSEFNDRANYFRATVWGAPTWVTAFYSCQRWPVDTLLIHFRSGLELVVLDYEIQGYYAYNIEFDGEWLKRYIMFPVYLVRVPRRHRDAYVAEHEMQEP